MKYQILLNTGIILLIVFLLSLISIIYLIVNRWGHNHEHPSAIIALVASLVLLPLSGSFTLWGVLSEDAFYSDFSFDVLNGSSWVEDQSFQNKVMAKGSVSDCYVYPAEKYYSGVFAAWVSKEDGSFGNGASNIGFYGEKEGKELSYGGVYNKKDNAFVFSCSNPPVDERSSSGMGGNQENSKIELQKLLTYSSLFLNVPFLSSFLPSEAEKADGYYCYASLFKTRTSSFDASNAKWFSHYGEELLNPPSFGNDDIALIVFAKYGNYLYRDDGSRYLEETNLGNYGMKIYEDDLKQK